MEFGSSEDEGEGSGSGSGSFDGPMYGDIQSSKQNDTFTLPKIVLMFAVVVECSGSQTGFAAACKLVKPLGTIVLKSTTCRLSN